MALSSTIYQFDVDLAHVDRGVYEALALRVACHPSESPEHLVTRVLAYGLECTEGIAFGKGLAEPDEPALAVRDLTGALAVWIDIGAPDARRLHKASKAAPRVVVYTHKDPELLLRQLAGQRIHRPEAIELFSLERSLIAFCVARLQRRTALGMSVSEGQLYLSLGDEHATGRIERHPL